MCDKWHVIIFMHLHISAEYYQCCSIINFHAESDISGLHKFVSVALHMAAGEGDYSSDKLSNLKIVGSAFKPLIYELVEGSDLETFQSSCAAVWETIKQAIEEHAKEDLPTLLVGTACN